MMCLSMGSLNTKGFATKLEEKSIPSEDHISYEGAFNQIPFLIGKRAQTELELEVFSGSSAYQYSLTDPQNRDYLAIFSKGSSDGQPRDGRILNAVIVLDVSGSMSSSITNKPADSNSSRIELAKEAIKMFYSKLRPDDSMGLIVFHSQAKIIIPQMYKRDINEGEFNEKIGQITAGGGTTLMSGFTASTNMLLQFMNKQPYVKMNTVNRIVMLTDVGDNSVPSTKSFIEEVSKADIHTTIIGVSSDFVSSTCQSLIDVEGFNYFCATQVSDLKHYLYENFQFSFFTSVRNIEITVRCDNLKSIEVFGASDAKNNRVYNAHAVKEFIVTKTKTSFPSELEVDMEGNVKQFGGLIMVKMFRKNPNLPLLGLTRVEYDTKDGTRGVFEYPFQIGVEQGQHLPEGMTKALRAFHYIYEVKWVLKELNAKGKKDSKKMHEYLVGMIRTVPENKVKELQDLLKLLEQQGANQ